MGSAATELAGSRPIMAILRGGGLFFLFLCSVTDAIILQGRVKERTATALASGPQRPRLSWPNAGPLGAQASPKRGHVLMRYYCMAKCNTVRASPFLWSPPQ